VISHQRVRGGLASVVVLGLLSACSVSISDTAATDGAGNGGDRNSGQTGGQGTDFSGARVQGVTDDTITLGVAALDAGLIRDTYGVDIGNLPKEALPALVEATNEAGGINGRQVDLKVRYFMPIGNEPSEKACRELVEDEKVFAVLGTFLGDNSLCVTETYSVPYIGLWGLNEERHQRSKAPFVTLAGEEEEGLGDSIDLLIEEGVLEGKKVAIYFEPGTTEAAIDERAIAPLEEAGIEVVSKGQLPSSGDAVQAASDIDRLLQRFESDGADTVLFTSGLGVVLPALERTSWAPQLVFANNGQILGSGAATRYGNKKPAELRGAIGAVPGLTSAEKATDEDLATCFATISERSSLKVVPEDVYSEEERPGSKEMALLAETCILWQLAVELLTAAGDDPTPQSLLDGLTNLDQFALQFHDDLSLSPTRWGAKSGSRIWRFEEDDIIFVPAEDEG
jgi:hypothetical protein